MREEALPAQLLGEPAWDLLLDLFAAAEEGKRVSVTSACIASGVPTTTALRYVSTMENLGLLEREECHFDRRTKFLALTAGTQRAMSELLTRILAARAGHDEAGVVPGRGERQPS